MIKNNRVSKAKKRRAKRTRRLKLGKYDLKKLISMLVDGIEDNKECPSYPPGKPGKESVERWKVIHRELKKGIEAQQGQQVSDGGL